MSDVPHCDTCSCDLSADDAVSVFAEVLGSRGGLKGGPARSKALTPERRSEIARKAADKRWSATDPSPPR